MTNVRPVVNVLKVFNIRKAFYDIGSVETNLSPRLRL